MLLPSAECAQEGNTQPARFMFTANRPHLWCSSDVHGLRFQSMKEARPFVVFLSRRRKCKSPIPSSIPERSQDNWTAWRPGALTQAFAGTLGSRPPPRPVVEERETLFTVDPVGVMLAVTNQLVMLILHTLACVSVTLTPGEKRDIQKQDTARKPQKWMQKKAGHREPKTSGYAWDLRSKLETEARRRLGKGYSSFQVWGKIKQGINKKVTLFNRGWGINQKREESP